MTSVIRGIKKRYMKLLDYQRGVYFTCVLKLVKEGITLRKCCLSCSLKGENELAGLKMLEGFPGKGQMCAKPCAGQNHEISKELGQEWYEELKHT